MHYKIHFSVLMRLVYELVISINVREKIIGKYITK